MTKYTYTLYVIALAEEAQAISANVQALIPDVGPDNVSIPLIPADGEDDAEPTHFAFCNHVRQTDIDTLFGHGFGSLPNLIWARVERFTKILQKRNGNETPDPVVMTFSDFLQESNLKIKQISPPSGM